jgi:hypothetical protein
MRSLSIVLLLMLASNAGAAILSANGNDITLSTSIGLSPSPAPPVSIRYELARESSDPESQRLVLTIPGVTFADSGRTWTILISASSPPRLATPLRIFGVLVCI